MGKKKTILTPKKIWGWKKILCRKVFLATKFFCWNKMLALKEFWVQKKFQVGNYFWVRQKFLKKYLVFNLVKLSAPFSVQSVQFKYQKVSPLNKKPQYLFEDINILTCLCSKTTIQFQSRTSSAFRISNKPYHAFVAKLLSGKSCQNSTVVKLGHFL